MKEDISLSQVHELDTKIKSNPNDTGLLHQRAELFTKLQEQSKAINDYIAILDINQKDDIAKVKLDMLRTIVRFKNIDIYANPNTNLDPWLE